jgi:hypothetical protein
MIAISTPRIQSSKFLLSVAARHGGQDMHIRAIIYDASQHVEQHTFEQSAGRCRCLLLTRRIARPGRYAGVQTQGRVVCPPQRQMKRGARLAIASVQYQHGLAPQGHDRRCPP